MELGLRRWTALLLADLRFESQIAHLVNHRFDPFGFVIVLVSDGLLLLLFELQKVGAGLFKGVDLVSKTFSELKVLYLNGLRFLLL